MTSNRSTLKTPIFINYKYKHFSAATLRLLEYRGLEHRLFAFKLMEIKCQNYLLLCCQANDMPSELRRGTEMHKNLDEWKTIRCQVEKLLLSVFLKVWKLKPVCHLLLGMPHRQRTLNLIEVAVISLWIHSQGTGGRAEPAWFAVTFGEEPLSRVRSRWSLCEATWHQPLSSHRIFSPKCKVPGLARLGCSSGWVWMGRSVHQWYLPFPHVPSLAWNEFCSSVAHCKSHFVFRQ